MGQLGAHTSIAGGLYKSIERGDALKCESIQIFVASSRTWAIPELKNEDVTLFKKTFSDAKFVKNVMAHNSYLLNLSSPAEPLRQRSVDYFIQIMERCEALGISGLVTHPGSHQGNGLEVGIDVTVKNIELVLKACAGFNTKLILENTAGQGQCIGSQFEELAAITDGVPDPDQIYFCFDTQHAFAAGYDLRTEAGYEQTFKRFDSLLGIKKIAAFHLNDSIKDLGCRVDRHENLGKGFLGKTVFRSLVNDSRFKDIPMCIETDPGEHDEKHKADLKLLRSL